MRTSYRSSNLERSTSRRSSADANLHRVVDYQEPSNGHCRYFIYQILRALKAIYSTA